LALVDYFRAVFFSWNHLYCCNGERQAGWHATHPQPGSR
jgi:hypothetical protein